MSLIFIFLVRRLFESFDPALCCLRWLGLVGGSADIGRPLVGGPVEDDAAADAFATGVYVPAFLGASDCALVVDLGGGAGSTEGVQGADPFGVVPGCICGKRARRGACTWVLCASFLVLSFVFTLSLVLGVFAFGPFSGTLGIPVGVI